MLPEAAARMERDAGRMRRMTAIPTPETVTAAWLTECLQAAGHAGRVTGFERTRIGTGQIGLCIRFDLSLEGADADTPRSLVGKFPSDDPTSRQTGIQLRNYVKEVSFYRELQSRVTISTPRCYAAEIEGEGPEFVLLLEDLAPAEQGDQLAGCSAEVAHAAVMELAGLHAPTWCDDSLREIGWLGEPTEDTIRLGKALYGAQLPGFVERYGKHLDPDQVAIIERAGRCDGPMFGRLPDPFAVVHVDYRLDNLLIDTRSDPPGITAVDWQSLVLGNPLADVAYFLGAGLRPEDRRPVEESIVRDYHARLLAAGVEGYDWPHCWNDYRRGAFMGFAVTVVASMMVQQTERGDEMFLAMARRHSRQALDLGSDEFLVDPA